jgi:DNA polymerase III delta subunit
MYKLLAKQATLVECGALADQGDAERWVKNRVVAAGSQIEPAAARLLAERDGTDIKRLRNDVERLLYSLGQKMIVVDDARQIVGRRRSRTTGR